MIVKWCNGIKCNWCVSLGISVSLLLKTVENENVSHTENAIRCIHLEVHNVEMSRYLSGSARCNSI